MTCGFPLQVKLINILRIFCLDELGDELELFAESKDGLLEDCHLSWCPFLEDAGWCHWVYEDVEVSLLVEMVDSVEVQLNWLFLLLGVGLVDLVLGLDHLEDWVLLQSKILDQLDVWMILALETGIFYALVKPLKVWLENLITFLFLLRFSHHSTINKNNFNYNTLFPLFCSCFHRNTCSQLIVNHWQFYIIDSEMYQLSDRNNSKVGDSLLAGEHDIVVQNNRRTCTDVLCLVLFLLFLFAFLGLLIFGLVKGNPDKVFNVYNAKQVQCYTQTATPYGFFPVLGSISNATCVSQCPTSSQMTVTCLPDNVTCTTGTITASYPTLTLNNYCVPTGTTNYQDISQIVNTNLFRAWALDLSQGWMVLVGAGIAAMLASMAFLIFVRCCTGIVIWITIFVCICGMEVIGVFFILEAKGVKISSFISDSLSTMTYNSLIIIGSGMIVAGVLLAIVTICLRSRIALGSKSVELGAMFLLENCGVILLPITQGLFILAGIAAIIVGGSYLYSLGTFTFPDNSAFPAIQLPPEIIVIMVVYLLGGFWLVFFFHGCNHFIICSAASIWYFNHESPHDLGAPFGDSLYRLLRFHPGSVAITSLINGIFYIVKILAHILSFQAGKDDHGCTLVCMKILSFIFCIFQCFLRFLNDGTYVQIAVTGRGYCHSAFKAFGIISDNITKISLTDGISMFFTVLGVLGIGIGVTVAAYFSCIEIQYLAKLLTNPLIVTLVSGLIGFVVAGIYLSMIDLSAQSIIQCYFIDHEFCNGYPRYARPQFKEIILIEP